MQRAALLRTSGTLAPQRGSRFPVELFRTVVPVTNVTGAARFYILLPVSLLVPFRDASEPIVRHVGLRNDW